MLLLWSVLFRIRTGAWDFLSCYVSQFTVETCCLADGRCLLKQPQSVICHWNQYDEEISKKCRSVRLSVCNAN